MTQELFNKLNEAAIKADKLMEIKTGKRNLIINELNEMYKQGCSVDDMIGFLSEEGFFKTAGRVLSYIKNPKAAFKEVGEGISDVSKKGKKYFLNTAKTVRSKIRAAQDDFMEGQNETSDEINQREINDAQNVINTMQAKIARLSGKNSPEPAPDGITRPIL